MGIKKDCFAYSGKEKECRALTELVCKNKDKCSFYMTKEQYIEKMKTTAQND